MKLRDLLNEAPSSIVYHFTSFDSAQKILTSNTISLSPFVAKGVESQVVDTDKTFYLSTTRSKLGRYGQNHFKMLAFVLDGRKLSSNYSAKSVDYWGDRSSEMEDRILSNKPHITNANEYIKSVDMFVRPEDMEESLGQLKAVVLAADAINIPTRIFDSIQNFNASRNPIDIYDKLANAEDWKPYQSSRSMGSYIVPYINAIRGVNLDDPATEKLIYNIKYYPHDVPRLLKADAHNASSTNEMRELALILRKLKLRTLDDMAEYLKNKYKPNR